MNKLAINIAIFVFILLSAQMEVATWNDSQDNVCVIKIVYPKPNSHISANSTFIVGALTGCIDLTCNNEPVKINKAGFFAHVVKLKPGYNRFLLSAKEPLTASMFESTSENASNTDSHNDNFSKVPKYLQQEIVVYGKSIPESNIASETKLSALSPISNLGIKAGDIVTFSAHAPCGNKVLVQVGEHQFVLSPCHDKHADASSLDVTYGKVVQSLQENNSARESDVYKCSYQISDRDHFVSIHAKYTLISGRKMLFAQSKGVITTVEQITTARTAETPTVTRLAPDAARTTPLVKDVHVTIDGWSGDNMRCLYSSNQHVWIKRKDLIFEDNTKENLESRQEYSAIAPHAVARTINIMNTAYGEQLRIPLTDKLPYQIEQKLDPNCLILTVYGVLSDTDWITSEPEFGTTQRQMIDQVTWRQPEDNVYEITAHLLDKRQWGYKISYDDNVLCLDIKQEAILKNNTRLDGIKICLDPGHGGEEHGSTGCSGLAESQLNLDIAKKTKKSLEDLGATVIMTRTSENENPSLAERVKIATDNQADLFISIHNNALPDGRDPWREHGTSAYWYHPQSIELARFLKNAIQKATEFPDLGARYQNLAIARAQAMPAVLLEIGFMINPDEFAQLIDPEFQQNIAKAIAHGLEDYLNHKQ